MKITIFCDEVSTVRTIPVELVTDDGRNLECVIEERVTSVGGGPVPPDYEVIWVEEPENAGELEPLILEEFQKGGKDGSG